MKLKVFEVRQEKPLSDIEPMVEKFVEDAKKNGRAIAFEALTHFENSFHRNHGVVVTYDEYPSGIKIDLQEIYNGPKNPAVSEPEPAAPGAASEGASGAGADPAVPSVSGTEGT